MYRVGFELQTFSVNQEIKGLKTNSASVSIAHEFGDRIFLFQLVYTLIFINALNIVCDTKMYRTVLARSQNYKTFPKPEMNLLADQGG
jgi:hypothetical protein